jgi:ADP-ribose pyrophosphatase YjhB (NUDIX family)
MTTDRIFCRFSTSPRTAAFSLTEIPADGICLSAFLVVESTERPGRVLLGRLNPEAPWDHLGALDAERIAHWKDRWMLPSSHLLYRESPTEAAERLRLEQTGLGPRSMTGPLVGSDVYAPARHPSAGGHWDLEFIFRTTASERELRPHPAWSRLEFVDARSARPDEFARSHDDILRAVGAI